MAVSGRTALVLYGSETGNAQDLAEELGNLFRRLRFQTTVYELNAVDLGLLLDHGLVVFVVSTTGQGDMPHNSLVFWQKLLRKRLPPACLESLRYTCVGLGDSTYLKFNWAARKLIRRLEQLGASTFMDPCEADEQFTDGIEGTFVRWADELKSHLLEHHPHPTGLQAIPDEVTLPPRWCLDAALTGAQDHGTLDDRPEALVGNQSTTSSPDLLPLPDAWTATIAENMRVTPETHWQDVRLFSLDVGPRGPGPSDVLSCNPGDCLTVYPKNLPDEAQRLITLMGWEAVADRPLDLSMCGALPSALHAPRLCTIRKLLVHNIDFTAVPRRSFLRSISHFASDTDQRERLVEFTTAEFLDEYFDYATRPRRTIIEVLEDFSSVRVPPERLLDVFPLIRGRDFSIANGGDKLRHPTDSRAARVELLVALVNYRTILRKPRQGLCSRYMAGLGSGSTLRLTHKPVLSPIHGPANACRPLVAMATGTGIAPVRSLVHERLTHPSPAPTIILFGNRNRAKDFFFAAEWQHTLETLGGSSLLTAFSRDQREKVYVQDLVRREAPRIASLIPQRPIFAVCGGSSKMADACKSAVFEPFLQAGDGEGQQRLLDAVTWWQEIW